MFCLPRNSSNTYLEFFKNTDKEKMMTADYSLPSFFLFSCIE